MNRRLFVLTLALPLGLTACGGGTTIAGSSWTFIATGFGPDWNPTTQP